VSGAVYRGRRQAEEGDSAAFVAGRADVWRFAAVGARSAVKQFGEGSAPVGGGLVAEGNRHECTEWGTEIVTPYASEEDSTSRIVTRCGFEIGGNGTKDHVTPSLGGRPERENPQTRQDTRCHPTYGASTHTAS